MLQGVLLEPALARRHALPVIDANTPEAAAWLALVEFCVSASTEPTTPSVIQHFAGSDHEAVLAEVLAAAADQQLSADQVEAQVLGAADRLRQADLKGSLQSLLSQPFEQLSADERAALTRGLLATATGVRRDGDTTQ
jgi:hypothetical protein